MAEPEDRLTRVQSKVGAPPPPGPAASQSPIGVPSGYIAQRQVGPTGAPIPRPAKFMDGDQWRPAALSVEERSSLQRHLILAGLIDPDEEFQEGGWDSVTRGAYEDLLAYSNAAGHDDERDGLRELQSIWSRQGGWAGQRERDRKGSIARRLRERAPLTVELSNPDGLRDTARQISRKTLGREFSEAELDRFVNSYQSTERQVQQAAYGAEATGGTVTAPPPPDVAAESLARQVAPTEAFAHDLSSVYDDFAKLLRGPGGG